MSPPCGSREHPLYRVGEFRQSIPAIGVVWPVEEVHGRCGCGEVEMKSSIAFFTSRTDAGHFVDYKTKLGS